ncbi:MAG: sigma-70 family RNA polymerase sigma factor [Cetobacterium sp.]
MNANENYIKYKRGEMTLEELVLSCDKLIGATVHKMIGRTSSDLHQEGYIATLSAIRGYVPNETHTFVTHLVNRVRWHIQRYVWEDQLVRKPTYLYDKGIDRTVFRVESFDKVTRYENITLIDKLIANNIDEDMIVEKILFEEKMLKLKPRHRVVLDMHYKGYTGDEIGEVLMVSRQRVWQLEKEAKKKIK